MSKLSIYVKLIIIKTNNNNLLLTGTPFISIRYKELRMLRN
jgi:hypothetical protein